MTSVALALTLVKRMVNSCASYFGVLSSFLCVQSIPLIVPAVGPPKIGTIADLALNPILLLDEVDGAASRTLTVFETAAASS